MKKMLLVLALCAALPAADFETFGWRIPFLLSVVLLVLSVYIRLRLRESPLFAAMKAQGKGSRTPIRDSFGRWDNARIVLRVLLGATAGQGVVWYTGQFYALFFLTITLKLDYLTAYALIGASLLLMTPFFVVFGKLSDRIGRLRIILAGCLLAAVTYVPIFKALTKYANPAIFAAQATNPVTVVAPEDDCSFQFDPIGKRKFTSSCDVAKSWLAKKAIPYSNQKAPAGTVAFVKIGATTIPSFAGSGLPAAEFKAQAVERLLEGGKRVAWGAKTIPEGGYYSIPKRRSGNGVVVLGDAAGYVEVASLKGVHYAMEFLPLQNKVNAGDKLKDQILATGKHVVVIGGGDTASDCLRTAIRLGAEEVTCLYRRTETEMPGGYKDRRMAREEQAKYRFLTQPIRFIAGEDGHLAAVECIEMKLGEPDAKGRRKPVPIEGSNFMVECDTAVLALGYWPDPIIGKTTPDLATHDWGLITACSRTGGW